MVRVQKIFCFSLFSEGSKKDVITVMYIIWVVLALVQFLAYLIPVLMGNVMDQL